MKLFSKNKNKNNYEATKFNKHINTKQRKHR